MTDAGLTFRATGELRENVSNSTLVLQITNNTQNKNPTFFLTFPSGLFVGNLQGFQVFDSENGAVRSPGRASQTTASVPQPANATRWKITPPRNANFGPKQEIGLQLIFKTRASGPYTITIDWDLGEGAKKTKGSQSADVTVLKSGESPDILNFAYKLTNDGNGPCVWLSWETDSESTVTIYRGDKPEGDTLPPKTQKWPEHGLRIESGLEVFRLDATNKTSKRTVSRWQFVSLRAGWNQEYGFGELLCMVNDSDNALYGVLSNDGRTAALRKFTVGIDNLGVLADDFNVGAPGAMRTSPGAFFQNAVWLVGGSQVDPAVCSNKIWCYQPFERKAHSFTANWPARMGHALVVFQNRLWILGGLDANGNALDDVWFYEGKDTFNQPPETCLKWTPANKLPNPICQPSVAAFTDGAGSDRKERLWLTGGVNVPLGTPLEDTFCLELTSQNPELGTWKKVTGLGGAARAVRTYASALCVSQDQRTSVLYGLATRQEDREDADEIVSSMFQIMRVPGTHNVKSEPKSTNADQMWPTKVSAGEQVEPFRLTALAFKNFIFVYSLFYGASSPSFSYFLGDA